FLRRIQQPQVTAFQKVQPRVAPTVVRDPGPLCSSRFLEPRQHGLTTRVKRARITSPSAPSSTMADEMQHAVQRVMGPSGRYKSAEQQDAMQFVLQTHDASINLRREFSQLYRSGEWDDEDKKAY
ncbi:MAG: hypothetical protein M1826_007442, partial [Phylliscum demangeonii]